MTALYIDGFDVQDHALRYVESINNGAFIVVTGTNTRFNSGAALQAIGGNNFRFARALKAVPASATVIIGVGLTFSSLTTETTIASFATDSGASFQVFFTIDAAGVIRAYRGNGWISAAVTVLATSATGAIGVVSSGGWCFLELSVTVHPSAGAVSVQYNGANILSASGLNTKSGGTSNNIDAVCFGNCGFTSGVNTAVATFDDLYIINTAGAVNNAFLGDRRVQTLLPAAAGSSTQWTPVSGANYTNVNDVPDNTASYVSDPLIGHRDTYAMADLVAGSDLINCVQQVMHARQLDSGTAGIKQAQRSGATVSYGAAKTLGVGNAAYLDLYETNPATGVSYTQAEINAIEAGFEVA